MPLFKGFPSGKVRLIRIPSSFFRELLPQIDHLNELKVTLFAFWWLDHLEGKFRYFRASDFLNDHDLVASLTDHPEGREAALMDALKRAVNRGTFLIISISLEHGPETVFFLNSPKGKAAIQAIKQGEWRPSGDSAFPIEFVQESANIFRLYEEHIGPITPLIAEALSDAEDQYPPQWIEDAFRIAVENNVRRWRYMEAILKTWLEEGRDERAYPGDSEKDRHRYIRGKFSEFIEH